MCKIKSHKKSGFTLVEALVGTAVFMILAMSVYQTYTTVLNAVSNSRAKITATALANEQFEIARNLPYAEVGTVGGVPNGKIPAIQNLTRDGKEFKVITTIRSIDDSFDGTIASTTDLSPADYKLSELEISCASCKKFTPITFTGNIGPRDLESSSTNGSLFIRVFDASSTMPLSNATVQITNTEIYPSLSTTDVTNNDGLLQIVDAPPAVDSYYITISKDGYSTEKSYKTGELGTSTPVNQNPTVVVRQLTQISYFLNYVKDLIIKTQDENCEAIPNIDLTLKGTRVIGIEPDVLKYNATSTTGDSGEIIIPDLDYDTYSLTINNPEYALLGTATSTDIVLNASSTEETKFTLAEKVAGNLLVTVKDSTGLPISDANIELLIGATSTAMEVTGPGAKICRPEGQALFTGLLPENYNIIVSKTDYINYTGTLDLGVVWQEKEIILNQ